jgi:hypothetical protein
LRSIAGCRVRLGSLPPACLFIPCAHGPMHVHRPCSAVAASLPFAPLPLLRQRLISVPMHSHALSPPCADAQTSIPTDKCPSVQGAFKYSLFHKDCMSQYVSHFAAFFIVARAKRSIVKSCSLLLISSCEHVTVCRVPCAVCIVVHVRHCTHYTPVLCCVCHCAASVSTGCLVGWLVGSFVRSFVRSLSVVSMLALAPLLLAH